MAERDSEAPCLCEFPGCGRQYLNEHSRRQHYRRAHGQEWANRAVRRRQKVRPKGANPADAINAAYSLACRRPSAGRTNSSVSPTAQRPNAPPHYRAFSNEHVGLHSTEVSSEWMLRSYDDDFVAANCRYLAMLRPQATQPTYLVDGAVHQFQRSPSPNGAVQGSFESVIKREKRNGGWQLLGRDTPANHSQGESIDLPHQEVPIEHQSRDHLWPRRILGPMESHAQSHDTLCTSNQGYRGDGRPYSEEDLAYAPSAMANAGQSSWLETKEAVASQCGYRSRPHSFSADSLFTTIQAKSAGAQAFAREHSYAPQYTAARGLSPTVGQGCYPQDMHRNNVDPAHMDALAARQAVSYRSQNPTTAVGTSVQCRDSLMNLQHGSTWTSIGQRSANVMADQDSYEVEAASYTGYTGQVISMARHGLAAPSEPKTNDLSRLRLHHSKAFISIFPPTPIEL